MEGHEEGIIRPLRGKRDPRLGSDAIMVMIPSELAYLVDRLRADEIPFFAPHSCRLYVQRQGARPGTALVGPFLGAPQAVMALERLIAFGAKRFWILGWCGSIQPDLKVGDWVVPVSAFSEEGTSPHYPIGKEGPHWDAQLGRKMTQALEERGIPFEAGPVWSTDAPFRETPSKVKAYQSEGVLAVEMEMSALMTVGIYRAVSVVGLLVVSDELSELTWRPGFSNPRLKEHSRLAAEMLWALATASTPKEGSGEKGGPSE